MFGQNNWILGARYRFEYTKAIHGMRERIRIKFDNELKRELKTTIVGIEDGYFAGKCDYERNLPEI
jgi:hypothetical protein